MTSKEIGKKYGLSCSAVNRMIKYLYPDKPKQGYGNETILNTKEINYLIHRFIKHDWVYSGSKIIDKSEKIIYKFRRCPFCKSDNIVLSDRSDSQYYVFCKDCHARGPNGKIKDGSVGFWNLAVRNDG